MEKKSFTNKENSKKKVLPLTQFLTTRKKYVWHIYSWKPSTDNGQKRWGSPKNQYIIWILIKQQQSLLCSSLRGLTHIVLNKQSLEHAETFKVLLGSSLVMHLRDKMSTGRQENYRHLQIIYQTCLLLPHVLD